MCARQMRTCTRAQHYGGAELPTGPTARPAAVGGGAEQAAQCSPKDEDEAQAGMQRQLASNESAVRSFFPHLQASPPLCVDTCMYTCSMDHDFVVGKVPDWDGVVLAGCGSGHAFKMGPAIGELAACTALGLPPPLSATDAARFAVDRPGLYRPNAPGRK